MIRAASGKFSLDNLNLDGVIHYLLSASWRNVESKNNRRIVFALDDGDPPSLVVLPASREVSNYAVMMWETLRRLAEIEETTQEEILQRILAIGHDGISLRLMLAHGKGPSLEITSHFFQGLRNVVAYGACMEKEPRNYIAQPSHIAREQTRHFQLTNTFQGSFGFTISSTIPNEPSQIPMQRRVLERITRGFLITTRAEEADDPAQISQNVALGFNANMCRAAAEMLEELQDQQLIYSVHWSYHLPPSPDLAHVEPICLRKTTSAYLQQAAQDLEETMSQEVSGEQTVQGLITNLSDENQAERMVTISSEAFGKINFSVPTEQYMLACDAHRDKHLVSVCGTLARQGKRGPWILLNPQDFQRE